MCPAENNLTDYAAVVKQIRFAHVSRSSISPAGGSPLAAELP
jgi:hypothetical protein